MALHDAHEGSVEAVEELFLVADQSPPAPAAGAQDAPSACAVSGRARMRSVGGPAKNGV
jgi:hypothetical protein